MYRIIANEADFLVISKSANVHFHSQSGSAGVMAQLEQDLQIKLYSVHRLDTPTSGLLLLAKTSNAAAEFTRLFSAHKVQKYYLAVAAGKPKKKQGWVVGDMSKSRRSMHKLLRTQLNPAITQFFSYSVNDGLRLYLLKPHSGKTHQLRVALASLRVPILGDELYGGEKSDRTYLHAYCLSFQYLGCDYEYRDVPFQGVNFTCPQVKALMADLTSPEALAWPARK
ncbi:TIGR01621 family pseudouridine synthase [Shewanella surugensis]|uniref:TIGR01621 family pseudouridine synthase n=1 Tax=Shewanella surugensis TaxID=212020 RepID=A0ABT0L9M9_9GAMM|nr:TIGR01621 family pseudouridine synthase [Shewanella surugensis]MCL1124391.1 TIGR01621 family pseudouridine synthase [Shewanella surugensis]